MYHLHHVCISLVLVLKRCMVCMTACEYMACMLLSPCCQDDYFLCSVILPVLQYLVRLSKSTLFDLGFSPSGCLKEPVASLVVTRVVGMIRRKATFHPHPRWLRFRWRLRGTAETLT